MSASQTDLSKLVFDRSGANSGKSTRHRSRWISRYVLPGGILLGLVALLAAAAGRHVFPKPSVTVVPVIVMRSATQPAGTTLFQAAGWIEPRPTSISVPALAAGVLEELLVVEGQQVTKGESIARLIAIDAEIALRQAKATLAIREAERQRAASEHRAAIARLENPIHLQVQLADARSLLAKAMTESEKLPFQIRSASATVAFTRSSLEGKQAAQSAIAGVMVEQAVRDHTAAVAELEELQQRGPNLKREIDALQEKVEALETQRSLLIEERRQAEEAQAKMDSAAALCDEAGLQVQQAQLNLDRTIVRAPMDGRILRLVAMPGTRVMGLDQAAGQSSSTVVEMYDPMRLQVRADVRLEDVPLVTVGAPVAIETASSDSVIAGRVLQTTSSASVQKNTLEVKVELIDPPPAVGPEMLVTASFLAPERTGGMSEPVETERIYAPGQLVLSEAEGDFVWIVDADSCAVQKSVTVGKAGPDGLVEIRTGLNPTDKLITSGTAQLSDGTEVLISGEDQALGTGG